MRYWFVVALLLMPAPVFAAVDVQEVVSKKGFKAWLIEEHSLPLVSVKLLFKNSGSSYDPKGKFGRAKMATALLLEGADDLKSEAFTQALEARAIDLSFGVDADDVSVSTRAMTEHAEDAFRYMGMALTRPRFDDSAIARVRAQMQTTLQQLEKDPMHLLQRRWETMVFADHPYAKLANGTKKSLTSLSKNDLKNYHTRYLAKDQLLIAVAGDVTAEQLSVWMDSYLDDLPKVAQPETTIRDIAISEKAQVAIVKSDIPQTTALFGAQAISRNDPAFYDAYVMNYLIGGGGLTSLLAEQVREERGLAYSISTYLAPMRHANIWFGNFATRNEKVYEAIAAVNDTLKAFAASGPTEKMLEDAKQYITGSFVLNLDSNAALTSYLISMQYYDLGRGYLKKRNELINAVTVKGVQNIAQRIADANALQMVLVGKPDLTKKAAPSPKAASQKDSAK